MSSASRLATHCGIQKVKKQHEHGRDTWLVFGRYLWIFLRNPVWVVIGVIQPALYLVLFAPLLESIAKVLASRVAAPTTCSCPAC
jgi:hypothetical protein